jgi:hypothetical protein
MLLAVVEFAAFGLSPASFRFVLAGCKTKY